ncbi:hypothetical protein CIRG_03342 [Coccidioides immitis RMSCC 2394]|uniref:Uncharacterized protein n=1 Tax=Coccidioides immitis RMSCC 2394 TaxID=404692 RepID=A0A0J6Y7C6_COCIT|nr:hypothetical protein CIRG_03342 [Coccidioides immitis RMSCC 2394]
MLPASQRWGKRNSAKAQKLVRQRNSSPDDRITFLACCEHDTALAPYKRRAREVITNRLQPFSSDRSEFPVNGTTSLPLSSVSASQINELGSKHCSTSCRDTRPSPGLI